MNHNALIQLALDSGATKATIITQEQIVTSAVFRDICVSNGCGMYGKCWMCPPDAGDIEVLMAQIRKYTHGLWYQTIRDLEDSFDFEGMSEAGRLHVLVSQKIQKNIKELVSSDALHLSCGGCRLCERCAKLDNTPCRMPEKALSSLEAYGIDVYQTTKDTDLKYINGADTVTYFGIVLFREDENV